MTFRPAFAVTAAVVGVLALAGLAARILQPAIPPPKLNRLGAEASESLRAAAGQRIDWRTASPEAFAEARRLDRPILLMIAASWCKAARDLDHECLSGSQIQNYLDRSFLCIRVDGQDRPDWLNAFLPVSRLRLDVPFEVGMQIWILDPEGKPFDFIGRVPGEPKFDRRELLARLVQARRGFEELRASPGVPSKLAQAQATDQAESEPGEMKQAAVVAALDALEGKIDPANGGFPQGGAQRPSPIAIRLLLANGRLDAARRAVGPMLRSPIVDWVDGGFFRQAASADWKQVEFDKVATVQAELVSALALYGRLANDGLATEIARRGFDSLLGEFLDSDGLVYGCRIGDEGPRARSRRSSFSPQRLYAIVPDAKERDRVRAVLGLDVRANPQAVPRLADPEALATNRVWLDSVLDLLRADAPGPPKYANPKLMAVNGLAAARLIEAARLWGDQPRLEHALALLDRLEAFRSGDDVAHSLAPSGGDADLRDYFAYADAALQGYLATGRVVTLQSGLAVLRRARTLFAGDAPGVFILSRPSAGGAPSVPEIADNVSESATAMIVRLNTSYGRLLSGGKDSTRETQAANAVASRLGGLLCAPTSPLMSIEASGASCALADIRRNGYAITVGPDAQALADRLATLAPTAFVAPAFGPVAPGLRGRAPGAYWVSKQSARGPMGVEAVASRLASAP